MELNRWIEEAHNIAKSKGFWDKERNVGELLMLVTSELGEALEAHRKGSFVVPPFSKNHVKYTPARFEENVKDSFEDEIADAVIRLFDLAKGLNIDLEWQIKHKLAYNKTRAKLHGKKY